jgi:imidazolonepropionase-like amidohydrolase
VLGLVGPAAAQNAGEPGAPGLALVACKILTAEPTGPGFLDNGVLLVKDGRIEAVGKQSDVEIPADYEVLDVGKNWLAPGLIDLHCHVAGPNLFQLNDINDMVYLTNPGIRVSAAVIPGNPALRDGIAGGVTSVLYIPGSGTNMGGQGVLLKTGFERYEEMEIRNPGSLKLAQAGNPERWGFGVQRSFMNWNTRNTFKRGLAYAKRWKAYEQHGGEKPKKDLQFEIFRALYERKAQVSTHTQIYQVVLMTITMVRMELGLDVFIDHGTFDGWRAAALAQEKGVPAIIGPRVIQRHYDFFNDTDGQIRGVAAKYQEEGHRMIGFNTDSPVIPQETLSLQAAVGVRYGLDTTNMEQLRGLTIVPAMTAGIADRVGSLEPGKDADVIVVTGEPTDPRSAVELVFIEGRRVYEAQERKRRW